MKDEIKITFPGKILDYVDTKEHLLELFNYITNLQEENEFLKLNNPEMNMEHFRIIKENKRKIDNLRKENKRLKKKIAHKMHLWIFLHSGDEQKVYDELGLIDEENAMLGYSGQFRIGSDDNE